MFAEIKEQILDAGVRLTFGADAVSQYTVEQVEIDMESLMPSGPVAAPGAGLVPGQDQAGGPLMIGEEAGAPAPGVQMSSNGQFVVSVFTANTLSPECHAFIVPAMRQGFFNQTQFANHDEVLHPRAPNRGVVIHGTFFRGGEFIPKDVLDALKPQEKASLVSAQRQETQAPETKVGPREIEHRSAVAEARDKTESTENPYSEDLQSRVARQPRGEGGPAHITQDELSSLLDNEKLAFISAWKSPEDPADIPPEELEKRHHQLMDDLVAGGYSFVPLSGVYGGQPEPSFMVINIGQGDAVKYGKKFKQEAVLMSEHGRNWYVFTTGPKEGRAHPGTGWEFLPPDQEDFYSQVILPGNERVNFRLKVDWDQLHPFKDDEPLDEDAFHPRMTAEPPDPHREVT
jgi:hypothetical protein